MATCLVMMMSDAGVRNVGAAAEKNAISTIKAMNVRAFNTSNSMEPRLRAGFALTGSGAELSGCRACCVILFLRDHYFMRPVPDGRGRHKFFFTRFGAGKFAGHFAF